MLKKSFWCLLALLCALPLSAQVTVTVTNAGTTGTTINTLTKLTGAPSTAVIAATTDTANIIGITIAGAGTSSSAVIALSGQASCAYDGATTAGDYVQISSTTGGDCHDTGSATYPTSGGEVIGVVLSTNGGAGVYTTQLILQGAASSASGGVTVTTETANFAASFSSTTENWYAITPAASAQVRVALPNTIPASGQCIDVSNASSYTATAYPGTTSANGSSLGTITIGALAAQLIRAGQGARICSDGTNYNVLALSNNLALGGVWRSARIQPNAFAAATFSGDGLEAQFVSSGTGPTMTLIAPTSTEPQYIDIASPATLNVSFGYNNALNGGWVFGRNTVVRERVELTATTNQRVWAAAESSAAGTGGIGTTDTPSASAIFADGIAFRYSTSASDTNWMACIFKNNVGTNCVSTGVAIATTGVTLMWQDLSNLPTPGVAFYVNGKLTNFLTTDYPTTGGNEENILYDTALTAAINHIRWGGRYVETDQ